MGCFQTKETIGHMRYNIFLYVIYFFTDHLCIHTVLGNSRLPLSLRCRRRPKGPYRANAVGKRWLAQQTDAATQRTSANIVPRASGQRSGFLSDSNPPGTWGSWRSGAPSAADPFPVMKLFVELARC